MLVGVYSRWGAHLEALRPFLITNYRGLGLIEVGNGEVWRLVTPIFIHFGLMHVLLNMLWLWQLGGLVELHRGRAALIGLVLVSSVLSNLSQFHFSHGLFGGMSGVVFALLGYLWMQGRMNPGFAVRLDPRLVWMLMAWFAVCWSGLLGLFGIHIANVAHTVGLVVGVAWGGIAAGIEARRQRCPDRSP